MSDLMKTTDVLAYVVKCSRCGFEGNPQAGKAAARADARESWGFRGKAKPICGACRSGTGKFLKPEGAPRETGVAGRNQGSKR